MSRLRQRMIEDMQLHGFSANTQELYVRAVRQLSDYVHHGPDKVTEEELRQYFLYLTNEKKSARATTTIALCGIKLFYAQTLRRDWPALQLMLPAYERKLPVVLSHEEVCQFLAEVRTPVYRACLTAIYSCGLRLSEGLKLRVSDVDSARMVLYIHGKGKKDRLWAAAHNLSYAPQMVMCSGLRQNLRRQACGSNCPAHNYLPLSEAMSLSTGRKEPRLRVGGTKTSSISSFSQGPARM